MEKIDDLLNELEDEIINARKALIGNNVIVNSDYIRELIAKIRNNLPLEISQSKSLIENVQNIKLEAQQQATEMIKEARVSADNLIKNSEVFRAAKEEADNIKNQALMQKDKANYSARRRVDELLESTEHAISEALMVIKNEREAIWDAMKKK